MKDNGLGKSIESMNCLMEVLKVNISITKLNLGRTI